MKVFIIPGFFGTVLDILRGDGERERIGPYPWNAKYLQLAPDGESPGELAEGTVLSPSNLNVEYYEPLISKIGTVHQAIPLSYDWRKSMLVNAPQLANRIRALAGNEEYAIIGHSMGGMLARLIYANESSAGRAGKVKRIITLGSPHWGSWRAAQAFGLFGPFLYWIYTGIFLYDLVGGLLAARKRGIPFLENPDLLGSGVPLLIRVMDSWPSVYELLPNLLEPGASSYDPHRVTAFETASYPMNLFLSEHWLANARDVVHPALAAAEVPADQLLTVRGWVNEQAPLALTRPPGDLGDDDLYAYAPGDLIVTVRSATLPTAGPIIYDYHAELSKTSPVLDNILGWLEGDFPIPQPTLGQPRKLPAPGPFPPPGTIDFLALPGQAGRAIEVLSLGPRTGAGQGGDC